MTPTMAPATGKAQPARAISAPGIANLPGRGSRVEKSKAAATSATSCLGEMTADVARSCMRPPTALYCDLRQLGATLPVRPRLQQESRLLQRTASMTMRPPLAHESEDLFSSLDKLRAGCLALPPPDADAAALAAKRQSQLTQPPGSLRRL